MAEMEMAKVAAYIAAGLCVGIGGLGPALGIGFIGGKACESIGKRPESSGAIMRAMLLTAVFAEGPAIYALTVALMLLFFVGGK